MPAMVLYFHNRLSFDGRPRVVSRNKYGSLYFMLVLHNQENYGKLQKTFLTSKLAMLP
jgi:hypothetical protein